MTKYYSNSTDFETVGYYSPQTEKIKSMLLDIDDAGATVESEGVSSMYIATGDAVLGAGKTATRFVTAAERIDTMLVSAARIHREVLQNIDSKLVKGLNDAFEKLNNVNSKDSPYTSKGTYTRTTTTTNYNSSNGYVTTTTSKQDHYTLDEILDGEATPIQAVKDTYKAKAQAIREQIAAMDKATAKEIRDIEGMSDAEVIETYYPRLTSDNEYSSIKASTYQQVNQDMLSWVDMGANIFAGVAMIAGIALVPLTGGSSLYMSYAAGTYLAGSSLYSAATGNTLITGDSLNPTERVFAGIEAVTTVLTLGGAAVTSGGLKAAQGSGKVLAALGNVADKVDDLSELTQLGIGIYSGDGGSALLNYGIGKTIDFGTAKTIGGITSHYQGKKVDLGEMDTGKSLNRDFPPQNAGDTPSVKNTLTDAEAEELAFQSIQGSKRSDTVVLGKYDDGGETAYTTVARESGSQYFNIDNWDEISAKYSDEEIWKINQKFLDIQMSSGREIYLSHDPDFVEAGTFYSKELNYLKENGYSFVQEGDVWHAVR